MKQQIGLITEIRAAIPEFVRQITNLFRDSVSISTYSIDDGSVYQAKKDMVYLTSAFSAADFGKVKKTLLKGKTIVPISLCLQRKSLLRLNAYPKGTRALLVNLTKFMAEETIAQLYQAGYSHIEFVPYYPGCKLQEEFLLAVTPGEAQCVPPGIQEVIDLGPRQIDLMAMIELAEKLDCRYLLETKRFLDFSGEQVSTSAGLSIVMAQNRIQGQSLSALIQMFDGGLIAINVSRKIYDCNYRAAAILGKKRAELLQKDAGTFLPEPLLEQCCRQQLAINAQIAGSDGGRYTLALTPVTRGMEYLGAFAMLTAFAGESCDTPPGPSKGHAAKYRFSDILGSSAAIRRTIDLAKKMAKTNSSVLITGESGTGKELFAHAIHSNSPRAHGPFVAINCAALPDSLLESELFGYEEGAFTGARKGGKTGLFELANTGSIFLDEIEGMNQSTQLKLLRVIQEREIMRVGGDRIIPIDVRIISASNQDLLTLIDAGKFRRDLFYRVGTLPLELPPLRSRREDIPLLIEEFKSGLGLTFILTVEVSAILKRYSWPGNIREVRNCVEYLGCQNLPVIEPEHLPLMIRGSQSDGVLRAGASRNVEMDILALLARCPCGRKQLEKELGLRGIHLTEGQLRRRLEQMKQQGWITSGTGRGGSCITPAGLQVYENRSL